MQWLWIWLVETSHFKSLTILPWDSIFSSKSHGNLGNFSEIQKKQNKIECERVDLLWKLLNYTIKLGSQYLEESIPCFKLCPTEKLLWDLRKLRQCIIASTNHQLPLSLEGSCSINSNFIIKIKNVSEMLYYYTRFEHLLLQHKQTISFFC